MLNMNSSEFAFCEQPRVSASDFNVTTRAERTAPGIEAVRICAVGLKTCYTSRFAKSNSEKTVCVYNTHPAHSGEIEQDLSPG